MTIGMSESSLMNIACAAILSLEDIPHWADGHVNEIRALRETIRPNGYWEDVGSG
jgi:hypothetical protein